MLKRVRAIETTSRAPRTAHSPYAPLRPHRLGQAYIFSLPTPSFVIARAPSSIQPTSAALLSIFRITTPVVFICPRGPRHPGAHFFGDLLEFTRGARGVFEPMGTCCALHCQTSTALWSLGVPAGPAPTRMRVEVFLPIIDRVQSY